jgi:hypothetical protein
MRIIHTVRDAQRDQAKVEACLELIRAGHPDIGILVRNGATVYYTFKNGDLEETRDPVRICQLVGEAE